MFAIDTIRYSFSAENSNSEKKRGYRGDNVNNKREEQTYNYNTTTFGYPSHEEEEGRRRR